jgi:5,10-methenyltetrahydrofolate synthetase
LIDWSAVRSLHYYEPINSLLEPDIGEHIRYLEDNYPNITLCSPRLINNEWRMVMTKGTSLPEDFDVVLVPTLGFDNSLNRLGYGGGYYDQFLVTQTNANVIGVSFEIGKVATIDKEPHDIAMSMVVTETNVYRP